VGGGGGGGKVLAASTSVALSGELHYVWQPDRAAMIPPHGVCQKRRMKHEVASLFQLLHVSPTILGNE